MSALPLTGTRVVSLEQAVAAPFATRQLAELGARVIKVERPGIGDFARDYDETVRGQSSYFAWLNRSKESVTLDVKSEAGRAVLNDLLAFADILVQNLGPGAAARLGLGASSLAAMFPRLIVCNISGYGAEGPMADRKAYDMLVQAEAGLLSITGTPETPSRAGISIADIAAGMYAFSGIMTALYRRATTGEVSSVDVSLLDALAEWMMAPAYYTEYGGTAPQRVGAAHATIAPYGAFTTADGRSHVVAVQNDREWAAFCASVLDNAALVTDPRFARNPARVAHRAELDAMIAERLAQLDARVLARQLDDAGIANAPVRSMHELFEHPSLADRNRWRDVGTPGGMIRALLPPASLAGIEPQMGPIPALGESTDVVLAELGYSKESIAELHDIGAV